MLRASERYFGVMPLALDLAQASMLAGLIQAPSAYDPTRYPSLARARQVEVLRAMVADGDVSEAQAAAALGRPLRLRGGRALGPVRGVDLSPGPAFVWWELSLGVAAILAAAAVLVAVRLPRFRASRGIVAVKAAGPALAAAGLVVVVLAFRTA